MTGFLKIGLFLGLTVFSSVSFSQQIHTFPQPDENVLSGMKILSDKVYTGSSLYGYINGGAELYKDYGFSAARVMDVSYNGSNFTVELYRMNGKEEAFGIFSVSRFNCSSTPELARYTCQTPYQLQICAGSYYINIINDRGKEADSRASQEIARSFLKGIQESSADFASFFPDIPKEIIDKQAILVKGELGAMNGVPELSDFLNEDARYTALVLKNADGFLISIRFFSRNELVAFAAMRRWDTDRLSSRPVKMPNGEIVSQISENHLLVRIFN